jgi:hypothetical protein
MSNARQRPQLTLGQLQKAVVYLALVLACVVPGVQLVRIGAADWGTMLVMEGIAIPIVLALATIFLVRAGPARKWIIAVLAAIAVGVEPGFVLVKWEITDWPAVPLIESVTLPIVLAITTFFLARRWPLPEWVGLTVLAVCVSTGLLTAISLLLTLFGLANEKLRTLRLEERSVSRHPGSTSPAWKEYFGLPFDVSWLIVSAFAAIVLGIALIFLLIRLMPTECPHCKRHMLVRESHSPASPWPVHGCLHCGARYMRVPAHWENVPEAVKEPTPEQQA